MPVESLRGDALHYATLDPAPPTRVRPHLHDSLWIGWTFTLFFSWIAFLWIGVRARSPGWALWGVVYGLPLGALVALDLISADLSDGWPGALAFWSGLALGAVSIAHAFRIRPAYVARREVVPHGRVPVSAVIALTLDLVGWFWFAGSWGAADAYAQVGAWLLSLLFAAAGALVAVLGFVTASIRGRVLPGGWLRLTAIGASLGSIALFLIIIDRMVGTA